MTTLVKPWEGKWDDDTIEYLIDEYIDGGVNRLESEIYKHVTKCPWNSKNEFDEWCKELYDFVVEEVETNN